MLSKAGIASLILGLLVIAASWYYWFQSAGAWAMLGVAVQGAVILFGVFLAFIGLLMLAV
ncbi:MAG: hypothetical protein V1787_00740 [Candidatus Micrarchaeota archaeon]